MSLYKKLLLVTFGTALVFVQADTASRNSVSYQLT